MSMHIFYRISDKFQLKEKLSFSKIDCLKNCLSCFPKTNITVLADNCSLETLNFLEKLPVEVIKTSLGNSGSFLKATELACHFPNHTEVYFLEDDYLHNGNCLNYLEEGLKYGDYATLFDYIDKYLPPYSNELTKVFRGKLSHWRWSMSTTMTFATTVQNLKEDAEIWQTICQYNPPLDHLAFYQIAMKNKHLAVAIPGKATHLDLTYYQENMLEFPDKWALSCSKTESQSP